MTSSGALRPEIPLPGLIDACPEIRIVSTARGRFRLDIDCPLDLQESA